MSVIPAKIAGVKRIVVVSPPNSSGNIDPLTIVASDICGATEIYKTGGAQSIAALTYGTTFYQKSKQDSWTWWCLCYFGKISC